MKDNEARLAVAHFPSEIGKPRENLVSIERLARKAAADGAIFLLLPEDCLTGYPGERGAADNVALTFDAAEIDQLSALAHGHGITIACGFIERAEKKFHCAHAIAWVDGQRTIIRKRSVDDRDSRIGLTPAEKPNDDFEINGIRTAMAICMDGVDEFFTAARQRGVRIILHPSGGACTTSAHATDADAKRINDIETANCRRCLEAAQQKAKLLGAAYCVANAVGFDGERGYPGNSWIVSPTGEPLVYLKGTAIIEEMREAVGVATVNFPGTK